MDTEPNTSEPSRYLSKWGMVVMTFLLFAAIIGGLVALVAGFSEMQTGSLVALLLGGGWTAGGWLGKRFGWSMFRDEGSSS